DRDRDTRGHGDWLSADSRHGLPDPSYDLSADSLDARVVARHDTLGSRDDRGAHPPLDAGNVCMVDVRAAARARHTLDARDHRLAIVCVLERDRDLLARLARPGRIDLVRLDVALLFEDPRELAL